MRRLVLAAAALAAASSAAAQDADATKPDVVAAPEATPPITISGTAALVTDYRFRGISQTDRDAAVQASLTLAHKSGLYVSAWGSSIDDYVAFGSDQELDLIAGYRRTIGATTLDVGVLYYVYPGGQDVIDTDFFEPYASIAHVVGPVTGKITANWAPKQSALDYGFGPESGFYLAGDLSASSNGFGLLAHVGRSFEANYITGGQTYTDWSLGASYTWRALTLGVQYVDTDADRILSPRGRNIVGAGVVGTLTAAF